jgi:hypothetical protein
MRLTSVSDGPRAKYLEFAAALTIYATISLLYFGARVIRHFSQIFCGLGMDPTIHMWALTWWPYAITHRLDPLVTPVIWAPTGYNLARVVSIPGPSLLIYPITKVFGPVVAFNVLCLASATAAALSAFVLCRYVCRRFWPALLGGYIFGFSQYVLSQIGGHLFLLFIFPVPLAVYLVLLRLDRVLNRNSFLAFFVLVVVFEFLCSTELFATASMFGMMALLLSYLLFADARTAIKSVIGEIACAYGILTLILSPYLYLVLADGVPPVANPPEAYSNDLLALAVPTYVVRLGAKLFEPITNQFRVTWGEMSGYFGPGVWLIIALFARAQWRTRAGKLLLLSLGLIALASLGPILHVGGIAHGPLPWIIAAKLPLIDLALPGRFGMYLFLLAALIVAIYLSRSGIPAWSKGLLGVGAVAFMAPNLSLVQAEATIVNTPVFFQSGLYKRYISKGDIILVLPYDALSQTLLWQAQTNFYFSVVTGFYIPPEDYARWPITTSFGSGVKIANFSEQLNGFLGAHRVKAIIIDSRSPGPWPGMLSDAGMREEAIAGVLFYKVPGAGFDGVPRLRGS